MRSGVLFCLLASCSSAPDFGFAVAVDIKFDFEPTDVTMLDLFVDGDEHAEFHKPPPSPGPFHRTERWVYRPQASSTRLTLSGAAREGNVVAGSGSVDVKLSSGNTVEVTLEIKPAAPPPDLAVADAEVALDLAGSDASEQDLLPASCTIAGCAAIRKGCDPAVGCVSCPALSPSTSHFYVDSASFAAATGTIECPFNTITQGLNAAAQSTSVSMKTVHLAAGSYGSGETFPLEIPGNTTLDGAGINQTVITGGAADAKALATGPSTVVSDPSATQVSAISHLSLRPPATANTVGILCYSGNTPTDNNPSKPAATTMVDAVDLSGYEIAVFARALPDKSAPGCNLQMTRSAIHDGHTAVSEYGCSAAAPGLPVAVQLGQGNQPSSGNSFVNMMTAGGVITAADCTAFLYMYESDIHASSNAIFLNTPVAAQIAIEDNQFHDLLSFGVMATGNSYITQLNNNLFTRIGPQAPGGSGNCHSGALCMDNNSQMSNAGGNLIVNNTRGLEITGAGESANRFSVALGDDSNIGGDNTFACNSNGTDGRDVWIHVSGGNVAALTVWLDRNHWDHASPSTSGSDGTDLYAPSPMPQVRSTLIGTPYPSPCDASHIK